MAKATTEKAPIGDRPSRIAEDWFDAALLCAFLAFAGVVGAAVFVFSAPPESQVFRAQTVAPFGVAGIAFVTFVTAIWRGRLTDLQVQEQKRQNDAKDEESLASLLVDGAQLLGEEAAAKQTAGIAALRAIVSSPSDRFGNDAMDILLDFVEATYADPKRQQPYDAAVRGLDKGARSGKVCSRNIRLAGGTEDESAFLWRAINGSPFVRYDGGVFMPADYLNILNYETKRFSKTVFHGCRIDPRSQFQSCEFESCSFVSANDRFIAKSKFIGCNFSGARISFGLVVGQEAKIQDLRALKNFFYDDDPPTSDHDVDWSLYLNVHPAAQRPKPV